MELQRVLERVARKSMSEHKVPGLSMAFVADGSVKWASALGVKRAGQDEPVSEHTVFEAASLSKPLFALGVLHLCERGDLNLDLPLTSYVDERILKDDPRLDLITTRVVLSHTTGLPNWRKGDLTINAEPGTKFGYSGEGFMYLQKAVERITGLGLEEFMKAGTMGPLGMTRSSYLFTAEGSADFATGHDKDGLPQPKRQWRDAMSAASLHTTPADYSRFLAHFMESGDACLHEACRPQIRITDSVSWGLGWGLEHTAADDWLWHWGDNGPFKAFVLASLRQRSGLVVMTNGANGLLCCRDLACACFGDDHPAINWLFDRFGFDGQR